MPRRAPGALEREHIVTRIAIAVALLLSAALALAACGGQSTRHTAGTKVCDARADVQKHVRELRGLTRATATVAGVSADLKAIKDDLGKIRAAQAHLSGDRRARVQAANKAFTEQVSSIAKRVGTSLSVAGAQTQMKAALTQLGDAYTRTLGRIDCG